MATLVHDDVLDAAPLRRGHATVWARARRGARARDRRPPLRARLRRPGARAARPSAVALLAKAALDLARGEALQSEQARRPEITGRGLPRALPLQDRPAVRRGLRASAALFGGLDRAGIDALERFGEQLGIAFQLADDLLDCDGDPETTGKALGVDLLDGTVTLPLLLAAQRDERGGAPRCSTASARATDVRRLLARVAATRRDRRHAPRRARARRGRPRDAGRAARAQRPPGARGYRASSDHPRPLRADGKHAHAHADRPRPREGPGGRATRLRRRRRAARERRPARPRRARRSGAAPARRRRRGLLRQQPLPQPHERLPGEVQVLRVRAHEQAGRRVHVGDRAAHAARRQALRARAATARSTWSAARARTSTSTTTSTSCAA